MSITITLDDLLDRSRRRYVPCTVRDVRPVPPRSPAAKYAGLHTGLPQCERHGVDVANLVGQIDPNEVRE